ncbi:hypothetical protein JK636_03040 [Clostridium sp. YIM B02515]|uniref:Uncharacterized protein n=1 Tax=Clostridium rhizosphaerae TaxID=2803861 RepID=A0ABS1T5X6_9CLOT|nr:hypothetical protein [Clostridium rhizosphaerae]MBL4934730.1 hypothetical protein [Clostridium rhizosphaerae]
MKKRLVIFFTIIVLILEISMHYVINLNEIKKSPSDSWGKEVLLDTADIQYVPKIVKFKSNYVVAYNDGQAIKLITTDNYGKKLNEKSFQIKNQIPYNITLITDDNKIYLSYIKYDNTKNIETMTLDDKFNIEKNSEIKNVTDLIQIDEKVMLISYEDRIEIKDIRNNSTATIKESNTKFLMGTKYNDKYVVAYGKQDGSYLYSFVRDGKADVPKLAGKLDETSKVTFFNAAISVDETTGYILAEYRVSGEFGGAREIKFSLSDKSYETGEFMINGEKTFISNVIPYSNGKDAGILASTYISRGKKNEYLNLASINLSGDRKVIPVSRVRGSVVYEEAHDDKVVFCQAIEKGKTNLYMTSSNAEFIKANNDLRNDEYKVAFFETLEKVLYGFTYIFVYGILWFVPAVIFNAFSFLFAYKCKPIISKIWFILSYIIAIGLKCYFISDVSYGKFKSFMPNALSFPVGMAFCVLLSIVYGIYGYVRFNKDTENNMMILDFSVALFLDTIVTLIFFVPFFV